MFTQRYQDVRRYQIKETRKKWQEQKNTAISWLTFLSKKMNEQSKTIFFIEEIHSNWLINKLQKRIFELLFLFFQGQLSSLFFFLFLQHFLFSQILGNGFGILIGVVSINQINQSLLKKFYYKKAIIGACTHFIDSSLVFLMFTAIGALAAPSNGGIIYFIHFVITGIGLSLFTTLFLFFYSGQSKERVKIEISEYTKKTLKIINKILSFNDKITDDMISFLESQTENNNIYFYYIIKNKLSSLLHHNQNLLLKGEVKNNKHGIVRNKKCIVLKTRVSCIYLSLMIKLFDLINSDIDIDENDEDNNSSLFPNEGILKSILNSLIYSFLGIIVTFVFGGLPIFISGDGINKNSIQAAMLLSGFIGNFIFLLSSGYYIQHFISRLVLYLNKLMPWNYASFLDWASERLFLQKVGGAYIFIHRMLQEHFANMKSN